MLLECAAVNKFAIVELTDDILIDTVVLANFEFFSSMIRHFKVSVSDRYPVKVDKWKDLGVFEAKNSRDIQPFLVENPLIWAKYVRIEFLTHYGNEYYCPVSLLRVHGTRMLDSWKDTEAPPDEDDAEDEPVDAVLDLIQDVDIDQAQRVPPPDNNEADEVTRQGQSIWSDVDAQDTQSDGIGSDPSSEDGSRTPPSPLGRLANTHDLGPGFRKPLPALPEHLPS
ncbi:hypothetical protein HYQ46_010142 [Verticillium longisporum]|nr:hypothetical protein HYQ46_010142 [Verticillium longisporum]